ncbi:MAG: glycosyltransferase family 4 protein [Sphingobacteriia bacterium]|nr:glycosyltransferase family 4 protein [Sphingobacteriia bacterium]
MPARFYKKFGNRVIKDIPAEKLHTHFIAELKAWLQIQLNRNAEDVYFFRNKLFQEKIPLKIIQKADIVIGFDTSSWRLIERCKKLKKKIIIDVTTPHPITNQLITNKLRKDYPLWSLNIMEKKESLLRIEQMELEDADAIVVASTFTRKTLIDNGVAGDKIYVNPYGIDLHHFKEKYSYNNKRSIRLLFVGSLNARKGVAFLLNTFNSMNANHLLLTFAGYNGAELNDQLTKNSYTNISVLGKILHDEMPSLFLKHDVFVFPSFFDGFGLVILEAMACGLPVITTSATGGPDIIEHGKEGFIIEPGNEEQLKKAIQFFVDHPQQIEIMGRAARRKAEQYTWDAYGERWVEIIEELSKVETGV